VVKTNSAMDYMYGANKCSLLARRLTGLILTTHVCHLVHMCCRRRDFQKNRRS